MPPSTTARGCEALCY